MQPNFYILISIILKLIFSYLYPWVDVKCYKEKYEDRIQKGLPVSKFWKWLFTVKKIGSYTGAVPRYRVFQKSILVIYWGLAYYFFYSRFWDSYSFFGWEYSFNWVFVIDVLAGLFLGAYYWMKYEREYYRIGNQDKELLRYQIENEDCYWLKRKYFSGDWLFKTDFSKIPPDYGFRVSKFLLSALIGTLILYATSLIHLINLK